MDYAVYPVADLEVRRGHRGQSIRGRFPYGSTATVRDRGRVRKERFGPRAFRFAVEDTEYEVHLLAGHRFDTPLASRRAGSLELEDSADALAFRAELPEADAQPTWMRDTILALEAGLVGGISPGFRVPPPSAVANAEELIPEPGNPGVSIRQINEAVLFELSLVTRPAYPETEVDLRMLSEPGGRRRRRVWL